MDRDDLDYQYPHLFQEVIWPWGPTKARFVLFDESPPNNQIANVNLVPRIGDNYVLIQLVDGSWDMPGGTREPDETYVNTIHRELMEEVGARLISYQLVGAWDCLSMADKPYRPYLPHPHYYRLVLAGEIEIVDQPTNPLTAERIIKVENMPLETAVAHFISQERYDLAELYELASRRYIR